MRASTIFALIIAVLVGLGAAVAVKASGFLAPREPKKEAPPPQVLVAAANIFEGNYIQPGDVKLRPARTKEETDSLKTGEFLPPLAQAAVKRVARMNIAADTPIRKDMLEDMNAPLDVSSRLLPGTRAVNVAMLKQNCAGGLIKAGDLVDVELVTSVTLPDGSTSRGCTAIIARNALVVAKRNSLYPVPTNLGAQCPVNFTLAVNPYRAGLIEFARDKGILALHPLSEVEKKDFEARLRSRDGIVTVSWSNPDSAEYAEEDKRVQAYVSGNYIIGEHDLERICRVSFVPPDRVPPPTRIQKISGLTYVGDHAFDGTGAPAGFVAVGRDTGAGGANLGGASLTGPRGPTPNNYIPPGLPGGGGVQRAAGYNGGLSFGPGTGGIRMSVYESTTPGGLQQTSSSDAPFRFRPPDGTCPPGATSQTQHNSTFPAPVAVRRG